MENYAPILITTLCRYEHFSRCVRSLSACTHSEKSELYVALDYPLECSHWDGYEKIFNSLSSIVGFRKIHLIKRDRNYGAFENFVDAISLIFQSHTTCIMSEDDNYFSKNFLDYMNKNLKNYSSRKEVFAVSGYNYPIVMPNEYPGEIYFWKGFSAWGFGIWKDRWESISSHLNAETCFEAVTGFLTDYSNVKRTNVYASHYVPSLLRMLEIKKIHLDTYISMHVIKNEMYCVFPVVSKIRNYGHDGSGINCSATAQELYDGQTIDVDELFNFTDEDIEPNFPIYLILKRHFNRKFAGQMKTFLMLTKFYINLKAVALKAHLPRMFGR